jgi:hypothetical protein
MNEQDIEDFKRLFDAWKSTFRSIVQTYIATKTDGGWSLRYGLFVFAPDLPGATKEEIIVETPSIIAGRAYSKASPSNFKKALTKVFEKSLTFRFQKREVYFAEKGYDTHLHLQHHPNTEANLRLPTLVLRDRNSVNLIQRSDLLDLELYSSDSPFDGVNDLLSQLGIGSDPRYTSNPLLEIAMRPPAIFSEQSAIKGGKLNVKVVASPGIKRHSIKIGVRFIVDGVTMRKSIDARDIAWSEENEWTVANTECDVLPAKLAQCFLSYDGEFLHKLWMTDPLQQLNQRSGIYALFDQGKVSLREALFPQKTHARNLEEGMALLLSLHGFIVSKYGFLKSQDGPDLVAETMNGKLAVVECTTDLPDKSDKLTKLIQRTIRIKEYLSTTLHSYSEVIPVLVSTLPTAEVHAQRDSAAKMGVALICKENIEELIKRLEFPPNPDVLYEEAKQLIPKKEGSFSLQA